MINNYLIERTIIDLLDKDKTPMKHQYNLYGMKTEVLIALIKELDKTFEQEMIRCVLTEDLIHVPSIGAIKIKKGRRIAETVKRELLNELGIDLIEDLDPIEREEFDARAHDLIRDIYVRNDKYRKEQKENYNKSMPFPLKLNLPIDKITKK
jgi:hypothetical protein